MLNNAFGKFDKDGDGKLNSDEFKTLNEILKPGIATDEQGKPTVDYSERMDHDGDGLVSQDEMNTKGVLMLADPMISLGTGAALPLHMSAALLQSRESAPSTRGRREL